MNKCQTKSLNVVFDLFLNLIIFVLKWVKLCNNIDRCHLTLIVNRYGKMPKVLPKINHIVISVLTKEECISKWMESMSHSTLNWISHLALKFSNNRSLTMGTQFLWYIQKYSWEKNYILLRKDQELMAKRNYSHKKYESLSIGKWSFQFKTCNKVSYFWRYPKIVCSIIFRILVDKFFHLSNPFQDYFILKPGKKMSDCIHMYNK